MKLLFFSFRRDLSKFCHTLANLLQNSNGFIDNRTDENLA